jgi:hypothetical protein
VADEGPKRPGPPFSGKRNEPRNVSTALRGVMAPLMRQVRRFESYRACLDVLSELFKGELDGLVAPHELRLASSSAVARPGRGGALSPPDTQSRGGALSPPAGQDTDQSAALPKQDAGRLPAVPVGEVHTLFLWVASPTVASVLEPRSRLIVERINARLRVATVEDLRCEVVALSKVQKQLEMLRLEPD